MQIDQIGKYQVQSKIGQGAMGEVFKGHDPLLNRDVAIKTLSANLVADESMRQRFEREAQAAAGLNHPNIITVYDFGEDRGKFYMAMELLEGRDLKDLIGHQALGDLLRQLDIMEQIAAGLAFAHAHDVTHRDLKPANIHVQPTGQVKILDFGLARLSSSEMTRTGMVMGTPHYMSPEQVRGEKVDSRSDIFSLGALFYELLSGHKPFDGDSMHTVLFHVMQDDPEPLRTWVDVPSILVELVERMLIKDTSRRLPTAALVQDALRAVRIVIAEGRESEATLESELGVPGETIVVDASDPRTGLAASGLENRVVGAMALDSSREPAPSHDGMRRTPPTLSGRSSTQVDPGRRQFAAAPAPRSRWPLYAGVGGALLAITVGGVVMVQRSGVRPPAPAAAGSEGQEQISALTEALAANQVQLAKRRLEDKNYAGAAAQADRALKLDARSAEAKSVLETAQGALDAMRKAEAEARAQIQARNLDGASSALWTLLSADPNHAAAAELTAALDKSFRAQAEEARRLMGQSRTAAEGAGSGRLEPFSEAVGQIKEGEAFFGSGAYARAAQKFLAARDGFERARRMTQR